MSVIAKPRPFIAWQGGKRAVLRYLRPLVPAFTGTYWEPFVGGGAMFFDMLPPRSVLSDLNIYLVQSYLVVQSSPSPLISAMTFHCVQHSRSYFYRVRDGPCPTDPVDATARLLYLYKCSFRQFCNVDDVGRVGGLFAAFPVPPAQIVQSDNIMSCSTVLSGSTLMSCDFRDINPIQGDFVYCDPPYYPVPRVVGPSFTKFTNAGFSPRDHVRLRNFAADLDRAGVHVLISSRDVPEVRHLYRHPPWIIHSWLASSSMTKIDPDVGGRFIKELAISNDGLPTLGGHGHKTATDRMRKG